MKTMLFVQTFFLSASLCAAMELPCLTEPEFADTEVSTNVPFAFARERAGQFTFQLDFAATASNNVEVAFGEDVDGNGALDAGEAEFVFAWDCGRWLVSGSPECAGFSAEPVTWEEAKRVSWKLRLVGGCRPRRVTATENGQAIFVGVSGEPPAWFYRREWDVVRITARGVDRPGECLSVAVLPDSFILRLR